MTKFCFACGQPNEKYRTRCYCGFSLDPTEDEIARFLATQNERFWSKLILGLLLTVSGVGVGIFTMIAAEGGRGVPVLVPYGAMFIGIALAVHALVDWRAVKSRLRK